MCGFSEKLALTPSESSKSDVDRLRGAGLSDREILDLTLVVAYYSYVNRIASGLGVPLEPHRGGSG